MIKKITLIIFICAQLAAVAQITSRKVGSGGADLGNKGVVYTLPKAVIRMDVQVEKITYTPGPYASYAKDLLGIEPRSASDTYSYKLKDINISYEFMPDEEQMYYAYLGNFSSKSDVSQAITFDKNGTFTGISLSPRTEGLAMTQNTMMRSVLGSREQAFKYYADLNSKEITDTVYVRVDVDTAVIQKASLKHTTVQKDKNARALDAAKMYMNIRKKRLDLLTGYQEIAYDGEAIKMMNQELLRLENEYLSLFSGTYKLTDEHYTFYCSPRSNQNNSSIPVFYFSESRGPRQKGGGSAVNIVIKSNDINSLSDIRASNNIEGIVYRVPQAAEVWAEYEGKRFGGQIMQLPQLGKIRSANINNMGFELYPATGNVKMIEVKK